MGTHFPFAIARHPSPYLLTENFRLEVQLEHVEMGIVGSIFPHIVGWYYWSWKTALVASHCYRCWDTWWQTFPDFCGISGFRWTSEAPIAKAFGTRLRGTSEVILADSDITSTRVSRMKIIKIRGVIKEFGTMVISRLHATVFRQVLQHNFKQSEFASTSDSPDEVMVTAPLLSENDWHKNEILMAHKSADKKRLQRCCILLLTTFLIAFYIFSKALCTLHKCPLIGAKLLSNPGPWTCRFGLSVWGTQGWPWPWHLSKVFDRIHWLSLWWALSQQNFPTI